MEDALQSQLFKQLLPVLDILKSLQTPHADSLIDITLVVLYELSLRHPLFFQSFYAKKIFQQLFSLEPYKMLKIIFEISGKVSLSTELAEFLQNVFVRNLALILNVFSHEDSATVQIQEIHIQLIEILLSYFQQRGSMELRMGLMSHLEENFLKNLSKHLQTEGLVFLSGEYCCVDMLVIQKIQSEKLKLKALRTKQLFLLLRLYNVVSLETYRLQRYEDFKLRVLVDIPICTPLCQELIKVYSDNQILHVNNVIVDRLSLNKSKNFILMETHFPIQEDQISFLFSMFIKLFNYQELHGKSNEQIATYLFEASLPCLYKFLQAFVYLCEEAKHYDLESKLSLIVQNLLLIFKRLNLLSTIEETKETILQGRLDQSNPLFQQFERQKVHGANLMQIKGVLLNLVILIDRVYPEHYRRFIAQYQRKGLKKPFRPQPKNHHILDQLVERVNYVSSLDKNQSIENIVRFCVEEFKQAETRIVFRKHQTPNQFIFLHQEYFSALQILTRFFKENEVHRNVFIGQILQEKADHESGLFFNKFWEVMRDTINYTAYNFFHNKIWQRFAKLFMVMAEFLVSLLSQGGPSEPRKELLEFLFNFKLATTHHNQHTFQFQIYVILECLSNYNKLLSYESQLTLEQKQETFFVIEKLFQIQVLLLDHPEAQLKVYVYRIDIWMNVFLSDDQDLNPNFYLLKSAVIDFFMANNRGENESIVRFYAQNVNLRRFWLQVNKTFDLLLE